MKFWQKKTEAPKIKEKLPDVDSSQFDRKLKQNLATNISQTFSKDVTDHKITESHMLPGGAMFAQDASKLQRQKVLSNLSNTGSYGGGINNIQLNFFAQQSFIGYQVCALLAQNWLIDKACTVPAEDAVRNGYKITVNDGIQVNPAKLIKLREMDIEFKINEQMIDFIRMGKIFGIRIALFNIDGIDYEKPFNIDGVKPNSYKSISQIDPYWITPELDIGATSNPSLPNFYKPTWWRINGKRIHYSHLVIYIPHPVADVLKPTYIFGGTSVPQLIFNRVYAAEKCANESPSLLLTKRMFVEKTDMAQAITNQEEFESRAELVSQLMDNYATRFINGNTEDIMKLETTLADVDETIMTQYQLVAAIARMPATKLIETTPKGFSSSGEYEEGSYHETLQSLQKNHVTPLLNRHHQLCIKSRIAPSKEEAFKVTVEWEPLDAMTSTEKAELRKLTAIADKAYLDTGAVNAQDIRKKIIADPESGYNGLDDETEDDEDIENNEIETESNVEGDKTVQQSSMNGGQVLALVQILTDVASNQIPADSAKAAITAAFNTLAPEQIDAMVDPMAMKAKTDPIITEPQNENPQTSNPEKTF